MKQKKCDFSYDSVAHFERHREWAELLGFRYTNDEGWIPRRWPSPYNSVLFTLFHPTPPTPRSDEPANMKGQ